MGVIDVEKGRYDEGIQEFKKMGNAYARQGRVAAARAILPKLAAHIEKADVGRYEITLVNTGLKDKDNAFDWLEKAYQVRDKGLTYLKIDPCLDPLRSDTRFQSCFSELVSRPMSEYSSAKRTHRRYFRLDQSQRRE
jgi:hypothetical protein